MDEQDRGSIAQACSPFYVTKKVFFRSIRLEDPVISSLYFTVMRFEKTMHVSSVTSVWLYNELKASKEALDILPLLRVFGYGLEQMVHMHRTRTRIYDVVSRFKVRGPATSFHRHNGYILRVGQHFCSDFYMSG